MSRIISLYPSDILDSCAKIHEYIEGMTFEMFQLDRRTADAVVRNLEIIGEAVKNLPTELKESQPHVDWRKIARFRDLIAHHYFDIDFDRVWSVSTTKLDDLASAVEALLASVSQEEADEID